jgi:hypothetical protein
MAGVRDKLVLATLVVGFATLLTAHLSLAARLALRARPRWRGLVALVVPPLAPLWGFREGWKVTAILWLSAVAVYAGALIVAKM